MRTRVFPIVDMLVVQKLETPEHVYHPRIFGSFGRDTSVASRLPRRLSPDDTHDVKRTVCSIAIGENQIGLSSIQQHVIGVKKFSSFTDEIPRTNG
jgi:hypothetical protein